ncbi:MAG: hypothetical protein ACWIPJ_06445, partial [Polaribacter sp.]
LLESLPFEEGKEKTSGEIEVVDEEIIEDTLLIKVAKITPKKPVLKEFSVEEKARIALRKSIAKKKAEEKKRDDENQTKLF